jgi:hypothetical protein
MCSLAYFDTPIHMQLKLFIEVDTKKKKNTNRWKNRVSTIKFELDTKLARLDVDFFLS